MEEWRDIPSQPGYQASSGGRIRSLDRVVTNCDGVSRVCKGRVLRQALCRGYYKVSCGKGMQRYVAHLVLEAFTGMCPVGMVACHNDGNKTNNKPENLRWDTQGANLLDRKRHGTNTDGEHHWNARLKSEQIDEFRRRASTEKLSNLAREYGIHYQHAYRIKKGLRW